MSGPNIAFTEIEFPSDHLTIKELRQKFPKCFDDPPADGSRLWRRPNRRDGRDLEALLGGMLNTEREVAVRAYYAGLGQPLPPDDGNEAAECLVRDYVHFYGLARGDHEARELIRRIETQAAAQAERHLGLLR